MTHSSPEVIADGPLVRASLRHFSAIGSVDRRIDKDAVDHNRLECWSTRQSSFFPSAPQG